MDRAPHADLDTKLTERGWDQGKLMPALGHAFYQLEADGKWRLEETPASNPTEQLIVVSQACDIVAQSERFVEAMPCAWHPSGSSQYNGTRTGNSARYFRLQKKVNDQGREGAIVIDATQRVQVTKASLKDLNPIPVPISQEDLPTFLHRFRAWLGSRYSRPALEDPVVRSVQRPIVDAIAALRPDHELYDVHELIRELRLFPVKGDPPYIVDLIVLLENDISSDDERVAGFRGLLEVALDGTLEGNQLGVCETLTADKMLVSEYENTLKLPLDHHTMGGEAIQGAQPVRGIDHG